jgi:hypothetical protein
MLICVYGRKKSVCEKINEDDTVCWVSAEEKIEKIRIDHAGNTKYILLQPLYYDAYAGISNHQCISNPSVQK